MQKNNHHFILIFFTFLLFPFFQNCSHRGFDSQVSSTPTNQIFSDPSKAVCTINGTTIPHAASIVMYQLATPAVGQACAAEQRICNDGILSGTYTNSTCTAVNTPPGAGSCSLNGVTVPHGGMIAAYSSPTVPAGTNCVSQQRQCSNGTLSGNYNYNSCSVLPPTTPPSAGVDTCPAESAQYELNASENYIRMTTGAYSYAGHIRPNRDVFMHQNSNMIIRVNVSATDTTSGRSPGGFVFGDIGPARAGRYVTISKTKCDYSTSAFWVSGRDIVTNQPVPANSAGAGILLNDSRGTNPLESQISLTTGVWYINIKNVQCSADPSFICDVIAEWKR